MTQHKEAFWAKVFFREFTSHFIEMTDSEIVDDVRRSMAALARLDTENGSFGAKMVQWANTRLDGKQATANRENGMKGGRPPKPSGPVVTSIGSSGRMPRKKSVVLDFATDSGLDVIDAGECWEASKEREWKDADGKTIYNWKAFVVTWCRTRKENRDAG